MKQTLDVSSDRFAEAQQDPYVLTVKANRTLSHVGRPGDLIEIST
ncbi:MAG TPA: hypothetical protein VGI32_04595 [Steroidobacteraceae bacterium]